MYVKPLNVQLIDMITCLPTKKIKKCLIGGKYYKETEELNTLGIECIPIPCGKNLDDEISFHADINIFNCGNKELIINESIAGELREFLHHNITECSGIKSPYPNDVKLNCALLGNKLIGNTKFMAPEIKSFCERNAIEIIHTNQGYSKCSLAVVDYNAVITEDDGLASLLKNYQINVLKIGKGFVQLSDSHYGFIGGACGKISQDEMYFSGDLSKHPSFREICGFLNNYKVKPIYNTNRPLNDFGGFIPL